MEIVVVCGRPGSGKGTHSKRYAAENGLAYYSSGEIFREIVKTDQFTEYHDELNHALSGGGYVSDETTETIMFSVIRRHLAEHHGQGFVLDGFPRNEHQAKKLDTMLGEFGVQTSSILDIELDRAICFDRMMKRAETEERPDNDAATMNRRLDLHEEKTAGMFAYYGDRVVTVPGIGSVEEVYGRFKAAITNPEPSVPDLGTLLGESERTQGMQQLGAIQRS